MDYHYFRLSVCNSTILHQIGKVHRNYRHRHEHQSLLMKSLTYNFKPFQGFHPCEIELRRSINRNPINDATLKFNDNIPTDTDFTKYDRSVDQNSPIDQQTMTPGKSSGINASSSSVGQKTRKSHIRQAIHKNENEMLIANDQSIPRKKRRPRRKVTEKSTEQSAYSNRKPEPTTSSANPNAYCFSCHKVNSSVIRCRQCVRSYHVDCVQNEMKSVGRMDTERIRRGICPECVNGRSNIKEKYAS